MSFEQTIGREEVLKANPLIAHLEGSGIELKGSGGARTTNRCAKTEHKKDHQCVSVNPDKEIWHCHDCKVGGSVIDWIAIERGSNPIEVYKELCLKLTQTASTPRAPDAKAQLVKTYDYTDAHGTLLYQVCRYVPKDFRQRQPDDQGGWKWTMEGALRVLYQLPKVLAAKTVVITEGEKDCDTVTALGWVATCNVGGAEKWLEAYSEYLTGKDVLLLPDNDDKGKKHAEKITEALTDKVNSLKLVTIPKPHKDVSDYAASFADPALAKAALNQLFESAPHTLKPLPIYTIEELEKQYLKLQKNGASQSYSFGRMFPIQGWKIRPMIPGELVIIMAATGVGKTAIVQNISKSAAPMPTLFFELEVPGELMFERFAQIEHGATGEEIESHYRNVGEMWPGAFKGLSHILVCPESGLSVDKIEAYINRSALKFGQNPRIVIIDYLGLVRTDVRGSRYEAVSNAVETLRVIAKRTNTIIFVTVQVSRPDKKAEGIEVGLYDAKDSGSIENSGSLFLGAWRPEADRLVLKVLKNTKGKSGHTIECNFDGERMKLTERSPVDPEDVPRD